MALAFTSWTAWCGIAALLGSAALVFVYLFMLMMYEQEADLQESRKEKVAAITSSTVFEFWHPES